MNRIMHPFFVGLVVMVIAAEKTTSTSLLASSTSRLTAIDDGGVENDNNGGNDENDDSTGGSSSIVVLEDFSWSSSQQHSWIEMNDPVMGGSSTGEFKIDPDAGVANFYGNVDIVSFLHAPGFIKVETRPLSSVAAVDDDDDDDDDVDLNNVLASIGDDDTTTSSTTTTTNSWPDISSCEGIMITARNNVPYDGLRISFGHARPPNAFPYIYGYKQKLDIDDDNDDNDDTDDDGFGNYKLPFDEFTDNWDAGTGDPIVTCHDDPSFCPDQTTLQSSLYSIAIWGEGVEGEVDLDIKRIAAYGCSNNEEASKGTEETPNVLETSGTEVKVEIDMDDEDDLPVKTPTATESSQPILTLEDHAAPGEATTSEVEEVKEGNKNGDEIMIEDFANPINKWTNLNDPVMGGKSYSTVNIQNGIGHFTGECAIVPFLNAPGFITMVTGGYHQKPAKFPDVSSCNALKVVLRTNVDYDGYRICFGTVRVPGGRHASGYKAPALANLSNEFSDLIIPFSEFSSKWDEKTGDILIPCKDDNQYCPSTDSLQDMQTISFWGEGVAGKVDLEIKTISAIGCASSSSSSSSVVSTASPAAPTIDSDSTSILNSEDFEMSVVRNNHLPTLHSLTGAGFVGFLVITAGLVIATFQRTRIRRRRTQSYTEIRGTIEDGLDVVEL